MPNDTALRRSSTELMEKFYGAVIIYIIGGYYEKYNNSTTYTINTSY